MTAGSGSPRNSNSPMEETIERAHRACEKCTRTKKKCDKAMPACSRCVRLAAQCCYDYIFTAPTTSLVDPAAYSASGGDAAGVKAGIGAGAVSAAAAQSRHNIYSPELDITAAAIMSQFTALKASWRESVDLYFQTTNLWLSVVHQGRFAQLLEESGVNVVGSSPMSMGSPGAGDPIPRDPELALLILCMHLATQYADSGKPTMPDGAEQFAQPAYLVAKRVLAVLRAMGPPRIELAQCAALLCVFEFGHGDFLRAYVTIGDAYTTAKLLRIRPGKYVKGETEIEAITAEEEERRDLYWAMLIVDRLIRVERRLMGMPFHVPSPTEDDLLPTVNYVWDHRIGAPARVVLHHPAGVGAHVTLGAFQRNCQCAILFTRALSWETESFGSGTPLSLDSFAEIDVATRSLIEAMVHQATTWGEYYECFATCTCLLLLLYCGYLRTVDHSTIHNNSSNVDVLKAIAGVNFTIRIIADTTTALNDNLARRPTLLATTSPVTPFSAYHSLAVLSNYDHVIPDADARFHDIYSSLHFFAKRWGVAGQLVKRIESFLATKDSIGGVLDYSYQ